MINIFLFILKESLAIFTFHWWQLWRFGRFLEGFRFWLGYIAILNIHQILVALTYMGQEAFSRAIIFIAGHTLQFIDQSYENAKLKFINFLRVTMYLF